MLGDICGVWKSDGRRRKSLRRSVFIAYFTKDAVRSALNLIFFYFSFFHCFIIFFHFSILSPFSWIVNHWKFPLEVPMALLTLLILVGLVPPVAAAARNKFTFCNHVPVPLPAVYIRNCLPFYVLWGLRCIIIIAFVPIQFTVCHKYSWYFL